MKLTELSPSWIYKTKVFTFLCPHCRKTWLTCKRVVMSMSEQREIIAQHFGEAVEHKVVGCEQKVAWKFHNLEFATMTITPSLDASKSGHWHGFITNGMIVGGVQV